MKKTAYLLFLSILGFNVATAQDIGIYYGTNTNFLKSNLDVQFSGTEGGVPFTLDREYKSDWGRELGITCRTELSHAISLEYALGFQKLVTVVEETKTLVPDKTTESFEFRQSYVVLRPTLHYWVNDNWSFTGNATVRMGTGGTFHRYDATKGVYEEGSSRVFEMNHLDLGIGVNYEMDFGLGVFMTYQKPLINFNGDPIEDYQPQSTIAFGLSFRMDKKVLDRYAK